MLTIICEQKQTRTTFLIARRTFSFETPSLSQLQVGHQGHHSFLTPTKNSIVTTEDTTNELSQHQNLVATLQATILGNCGLKTCWELFPQLSRINMISNLNLVLKKRACISSQRYYRRKPSWSKHMNLKNINHAPEIIKMDNVISL